MGEEIDLKALEKKAWTSYFQDGLLEIVWGTIMLAAVLSSTMEAAGVGDALRIAAYVPLMVIAPPLIWIAGKKYITVPRLGVAIFGPKREANHLKMFVGILATMLLNLAIWGFGMGNPAGQIPYGMILVTIDVFAILGLVAYYLDYRRFYIVAALMALSEPMVYLLKQYTGIAHYGLIAYGIPAAIVLAMGLSSLAGFMRRYDVQVEAHDAG